MALHMFVASQYAYCIAICLLHRNMGIASQCAYCSAVSAVHYDCEAVGADRGAEHAHGGGQRNIRLLQCSAIWALN